MPVKIIKLTMQSLSKKSPPLDKMPLNLTGHAEIDQQHELLNSAVSRLATFCSEAKHNPAATCDGCNAFKQRHCGTSLALIASELAAFLSGHSAYEEKMMELLPNTPVCQEHVKAHKSAHEGIAKQLKKFSAQIVDGSPRDISELMTRTVGDWLGDHSRLFDIRLVRLGKFDETKVDFDTELVTMLDQYVFQNRPTKLKLSLNSSTALQEKKLEVRGRFETLSPAQRRVFWLVIGGNSNREIGNTLKVSVNTIKTHRAAIFQRMDVKSVLELVKKADVLR
ncbi:MAG: LuxR C-terminal-related transcriptional regulator [Gallionella sp.]|nr:LuxR C-terminal-related transcriptional regulator [Gallionella sp.]